MHSYKEITTSIYSPWETDEEFKAVYSAVKEHTLVDIYRCYTLWSLVQQIDKFHLSDILEVGVWRGGTGVLLAKSAELRGRVSDIFLCDTFKGVVKQGERDLHYEGGEHSDTSEAEVRELLKQTKAPNTFVLPGIFPEETGDTIADRAFRFCHIDVDVYQSAKDVTEWVWPRLVRNGIVVYDDYGFSMCSGVTEYVNEIAKDVDKLFIYNLNGQAIMIKL